jgi:hypothetical protein
MEKVTNKVKFHAADPITKDTLKQALDGRTRLPSLTDKHKPDDLTAREEVERKVTRVEQLMLRGVYDPSIITELLQFTRIDETKKYIGYVHQRWAIRGAKEKDRAASIGVILSRIEHALAKTWTAFEQASPKQLGAKATLLKNISELIKMQATYSGISPQQINLFYANLGNDKKQAMGNVLEMPISNNSQELAQKLVQKIEAKYNKQPIIDVDVEKS